MPNPTLVTPLSALTLWILTARATIRHCRCQELTSVCFCTVASSIAAATAPAWSMPTGTSTVPRILPFTCTAAQQQPCAQRHSSTAATTRTAAVLRQLWGLRC